MKQKPNNRRLETFKVKPCVLIHIQILTYLIGNAYAVVDNSVQNCLFLVKRKLYDHSCHTSNIMSIRKK